MTEKIAHPREIPIPNPPCVGKLRPVIARRSFFKRPVPKVTGNERYGKIANVYFRIAARKCYTAIGKYTVSGHGQCFA